MQFSTLLPLGNLATVQSQGAFPGYEVDLSGAAQSLLEHGYTIFCVCPDKEGLETLQYNVPNTQTSEAIQKGYHGNRMASQGTIPYLNMLKLQHRHSL